MHPIFDKVSSLTETVIAAAIEAHRDKGAGRIESIYEWCLLKELELRGLSHVSQQSVLIKYKGFTERILPIHKAKLLRYMKLLDLPLSLLINFHEMKVTDGVNRLLLPEQTSKVGLFYRNKQR